MFELEIIVLFKFNYFFFFRRDSHDYTALHWAAQAGKEDVVVYLLDNNANLHAHNCGGDRPIHYASAEGHFSIVKLVRLLLFFLLPLSSHAILRNTGLCFHKRLKGSLGGESACEGRGLLKF